jgi:hypothetical protein
LQTSGGGLATQDSRSADKHVVRIRPEMTIETEGNCRAEEVISGLGR